MLTSRDLSRMRETQADFFPSTGTRTRRTPVADGAGGYTETTTTATTDVRLAVSTYAPDREIRAGKVIEGPAWRVYCAQSFDVKADDMWTIDGRNFEILAVYAGSSWETARMSICEEKL